MHHSLVCIYRAQSYVNEVNKKKMKACSRKEKVPGSGLGFLAVPKALISFCGNLQ